MSFWDTNSFLETPKIKDYSFDLVPQFVLAYGRTKADGHMAAPSPDQFCLGSLAM